MTRPIAKMSEQLNRKCPARNTTIQLSTSQCWTWAFKLPTPNISNAVQRRMHVLLGDKWCSCDAREEHII